MKVSIFSLFALITLAGCATEFMGNAYVTRPYCENYCKKNDLDFTGMVALGEYSSGCICSKPKEKSLTNQSAATAGASAAGVMTAMRVRQNLALIGGGAAIQH